MIGSGVRHPNDVDRKRIERSLENRRRYRYVSPIVEGATSGYVIKSPCCSRNIDGAGGVIDIACVEFHAPQRVWRLFCKDHVTGEWLMYARCSTLSQVLCILNDDPERRFWQ
jgi:hypothetical protein